MTYVNYLGQEIGLIDHGTPKKAKKDEVSFHNGWNVVGIPPGKLEEARRKHKLQADLTRAHGRQPKEWDETHWLMNAKQVPVNSRPYGVPQAAQECKRLAEAAGWLRVEIVEMKKEVAPKGGKA